MKKLFSVLCLLAVVQFATGSQEFIANNPEKPVAGDMVYEQFLKYGNYTVRIQQIGQLIRVTPEGFARNQVWELDVENPYVQISNAEISDISGDNIPEVFVYTTSTLPDANGDVYAFTITRNKSMLPIYMPPINDDPEARIGYVGHDEFAVVETTLVRRFPKYNDNGDIVGTKQIQYKMVPGEAGYILQRDRIVEY